MRHPTNYHLFKHLDNFAGKKSLCVGKLFHNQQEAENAFQEFVDSQSMDFYDTGISLFLVGKSVFVMVPHCNGSYFDYYNKDAFEPKKKKKKKKLPQ